MFFRNTARRFGVLVAMGLAVSACDDVSVNPIGVASIEISPRQLELAVGSLIQLSATARAADGSELPGVALQWSSSDPALATVDGSGRVTGLGPGAVAITASSAGAVGSAAVRVDLPAQVSLSAPDVVFEAVLGGAAPASARVGIRNVGGVSLVDLQTQVVYQAGAAGWLDARLEATTAPTDLVLQPDISGLSAGTYGARVTISSSSAGTAQDLVVTLVVLPAGPAISLGADSVQLRGVPTASSTVTVTNGGTGSLTGLSARPIYEPQGPTGWLTARVLGSTAPTTLSIVGNAGALAPGTYGAEVEVASSAAGVSAKRIRVIYEVVALPPAIALSRSSVTLTATQGQPNSPSSSIDISNAGNGVLDGLGTSVSYGSGQPSGWLTAALSQTTAPATLTLTGGVAGLVAGQYDASVEVRGSAGNSPQFLSVTLTVNPPGALPPAAPTNLSAAAASTGEVSLTWTDNATTETFQVIERSSDGGATWVDVFTAPANQVSHTDTGLTAGTTYLYRVQACNGVGCSTYSNTATVTTPAPVGIPAPPTGLTVTPVTATDANLTWSDQSTNETGFEIERRGATGPWVQVVTLPAGAQAYQVQGLAAGEVQEFRVRACNSSGCSSWATASVVMPPTPPSGLTATSVTATQVDLAWTDNSSNEVSFVVLRGTNPTAPPNTRVATLAPNSTTWSDTGVTSGTVYFYRVAACAPQWCIVSNTIGVTTP